MGKITNLPTQRVLRALRRAGWEIDGGGKHYKLIHPTKPGAMAVPRGTPLKKGTIRAIIRQSGLSLDEFWKLYK
ncbi:MAG: type II toxin-antitoxin system HicA family toxin [Phycisphaerae bacterium]|nr:type II toxin-antitoxin system HicA family toxin [Phycisphaerae bacterium]